jgi:hypothetical protein
MSEEPNDGGPAFPAMLPGGNYCTPGMSLRDWFAGQALAGFFTLGNHMPNETIACQCYGMADAMIAYRDQQPDTTTAQQIALGIRGGK